MVRLLIMIVACFSANATALASDNVPRRKSGLWSMSVIDAGRVGSDDDATVRRREDRRYHCDDGRPDQESMQELR